MSIYNCPHCGKRAFNPITKAFAGQLNSHGRVCKYCGKHCCNGWGSTIFRSIVWLIAVAISIVCYIGGYGITIEVGSKVFSGSYVVIIICIVSAFIISTIFDAFFLPMTRPMRNDIY